MRLSWYADSAVAVFSIWQGNRCTATFRLPFGDLARMVEALQSGPPAHVAHPNSPHSAELSFEASRSAPGYGHPEQPAYRPAAAYSEHTGYESRRGYETERGYVPGYQTGPGYEPGPHYGVEPNDEPAPRYGSGHDYGSGRDYESGHDYMPGPDYGGEPAYGHYPHDHRAKVQQYRDDHYSNPHPTAADESTGPGYRPPGYREAQRTAHDLPAGQPDTAPYRPTPDRAAPAYLTAGREPVSPTRRGDAGRPATAYSQPDRGEGGKHAYAPGYPGETSGVRFPSASVTPEHAGPDWDSAAAAYRDR
jgi:hypothetical protein